MGTQFNAIVIVAVLIGGLVAYVIYDKKLKKGTGKNIGDWFWDTINALVGVAMCASGLNIVSIAMDKSSAPLAVLGIFIALVGVYIVRLMIKKS